MSSEPPPPDDHAIPESAALLSRRGWMLALCAFMAFVWAPLYFFTQEQTGPSIATAVASFFLGLVLLYRNLKDPATFVRAQGALRIEQGALWVGARRLFGRAEVAQSFVSRNPKGGAFLQVQTREGWHQSMPWTIALDDEAGGEAILRALRLDASRSVASYQVGSRLMMHRRARNRGLPLFAVGVVLAFCALIFEGAFSHGPASITGPLTIIGTLLSMLAFSLVWPSRVLVGPDGVVIRWLGTSRRIPLGELESVWQQPGTLRLSLRSGEVIELAYPGKAPSEEQLAAWQQQGITSGVAELARAGARIEEALEAHRRGHAIAPELSLERGTRGAREWLKQIQAVSRGTQAEKAGYRKQVVEPDKLWTLVENPSMTPTMRVGAAVALAGTLDEAGRARLRVAAEASALPGVKGALDALAREKRAEEEELTALLEAAAADEDEEQGKGKSRGRSAR